MPDPETTGQEQQVNTSNDRDPAALEPDPTGVRALLAALPDPGPMPPEVTARITASLQRAQEQRQQGQRHDDTLTSEALSAPQRTPRTRVTRSTTTVSSLDQRRRSRTPHVLAAAASIAAVALAGVVVLDQVVGDGSLADMAAVYRGDSDSAGSRPAADEAGQAESMAGGGGSDSSVATGQEGQQSAPDSQQDAGAGDALGEAADDAEAAPGEQLETDTLPGDLRVISVSEPMSADTFSVGVSSALTAADADPSDKGAADDGAALSPGTVQPCLDATGEAVATQTWIVSAITLDGDDAILVVAAGEPDRAWALAPACVLGDERAEIRLGPVDVP